MSSLVCYITDRFMKTLKKMIAAVLSLVCFTAVAQEKTTLVWTEGAKDAQTGRAIHTLEVLNAPQGVDWAVWMTANHLFSEEQEGSQGQIDLHHGCWYKMTPYEHEGKNLVVRYADNPLQRHCWAPEGFVLEHDGKAEVLDVQYIYQPYERIEDFSYNHVQTKPWDMVPSLKKVVPSDGCTVIKKAPKAKIVKSQKPGWYRIVLDGKCRIEAADEDGAQYAKVTLENLIRNAGGNKLPNLVIEDWPDLQYRGFMLDISRNFTNKDNILKLIDLLAHYKVNVFHLHFGDDEGWRLEIPELPELVTYGAYHAFPKKNSQGEYVEVDCLLPSYNGNIDPTDVMSTANGHLTKEDYIEILEYAWERRISVIPEFDTPGHSRAAIKAMEAYAKRTGDTRYLLSDPEDTSKYCSVQYYRDNAINVALPSTYNFIELMFDKLIEYHKEAGVPLPAVHVGGDEVPHGAWVGSEACQKIMAERGWDNIELLKSYYIEKVLDIAEARGVKIAGWQELVMDLEDHVYERLKENLYSVNFWNTGKSQEEFPYKYANDGVPVVLSNMTNTYMDLAYTPDKTERGLSWGGFVDERRSFSLLPYDIYRSVRWDDRGKIRDISNLADGKTVLNKKENIVGVQAQLWTETVRCFDHVTSYVFPKVCGVFERAWNASPSWEGTTKADNADFLAALDLYYSTVVSHELPYYEEQGIAYRHRKGQLPVLGDYQVYEVDVEEISGLCFNQDKTALMSCGDQGVVKSITFDGQVSKICAFKADMEGITLDPDTGDLYLAVEGKQQVYRLSAPDYASHESLFAVKEAVENNYRNGGLEAVEYYRNGVLFVGSQTEANLWQYQLDGTMLSKISLAYFATEIAGLHYEKETDLLWVTDSNVAKIFLCTPQGALLAEYDVPFVENLESICVDREHGCVWVASDVDAPKLYRLNFVF